MRTCLAMAVTPAPDVVVVVVVELLDVAPPEPLADNELSPFDPTVVAVVKSDEPQLLPPSKDVGRWDVVPVEPFRLLLLVLLLLVTCELLFELVV